jgi:hypothetical protein
MTVKEIRVLGLTELVKKCDWDVLAQPEAGAAVETISKRLLRKSKGLGAQRNELSADVRPLGATITSTLGYPRTTGSSWGRKEWQIALGMAPRVAKKMVQRIEERWAAENAASIGPGNYEGLGG